MKNLMLTIVTGLVLLTSCSKDEPIETPQELNSEFIHLLHQDGDTSFWETISLDDQNLTGSNSSYSGSLQSHTRGLYSPPYRSGIRVKWSGTQTANTRSGEAELTQETPSMSYRFKMTTECVMANGNEAVYAGLITKIEYIHGDTPNIAEGFRLYFKVVDAGLGLGSTDQISNTLVFASPFSMSLCNIFTPDHYIWNLDGYSVVDGLGFVEVSN